jgi:hypothetical protein
MVTMCVAAKLESNDDIRIKELRMVRERKVDAEAMEMRVLKDGGIRIWCGVKLGRWRGRRNEELGRMGPVYHRRSVHI